MIVKHKSFLILGLILGLASFFIWISLSPENHLPTTPVEQNEGETQQKKDNADHKDKEENSDSSDDKTISDGIKEAVTRVVEGAMGVFVKENLDIVAIGDSLTQGVGDESDNGGYVGILEKSLKKNDSDQNIEIENYGKRGNRTDQLLKRLNKEEISESVKEADIILMTIGANDIMKIVKDNFTDLKYEDFVKEQTRYETRLQSIFDTIQVKNPDVKIFLIGIYNPFNQYFSEVPELGKIMNDWNNISRDVASQYDHISFIPIADLFEGRKDLYYKDNFHPNLEGYQLIAERVFEYIKESIQQEDEKA